MLVLGQDPGHQLLLQRRASRALQGIQSCSPSGISVSVRQTEKRCYSWTSMETSTHPRGHHVQVTLGQPLEGDLSLPFAVWMHRLSCTTCRTQEAHQHSFRELWGSFDVAPSQSTNPTYQNVISLQHGCYLASDLGQKVLPCPTARTLPLQLTFCLDAKHQKLTP